MSKRNEVITAMARAINPEAWEDDGNWCKTFQFAHRRAAWDRATAALDAAISILETPSDEMVYYFGRAVDMNMTSSASQANVAFGIKAMLNTLKAPA